MYTNLWIIEGGILIVKTVLVTSVGSVASDIVIKTLKRYGYRIVGCDIYAKELVVDANNVNVFYKAAYVNQVEKYFDFIKGVCIQEKIDFIIPLIDLEIDFFNDHREWFAEHQVTLCMSPKDSIDIIRNKKKLQDFLGENCSYINSIPTDMLYEIETLEWEYPVVCKPYNGRSSQGLRYIHNIDEWTNVKNLGDETLIVEPFIAGPIVMVEVVREPKQKKVVTMTRREVLSTPHGCATAVYLYKDTALEESCEKLAEALNIVGCVNFEFIQDEEGKYWFVECNPRFSAGTEFSCMGGYDLVLNHIKCFLGDPIEDFHFQHEMTIARKYEEYITSVCQSVEYMDTVR